MSQYEMRVNTTIKFDFEKEKDIILQLGELASRKKLGEFVSNAVRVVLDNPELLKKDKKSLLEYGLTEERAKFFKDIKSSISNMQAKVDKIFDMTYKVYMLAMVGKRLGLDKRAENLVLAQYILQRQIDEICSTLGVQAIGYLYESNRLDSFKSKADEIIDYIIQAYDDILSEIKSMVVMESNVEGIISNTIASKAKEVDSNNRGVVNNYENQLNKNDNFTINNQLDKSSNQMKINGEGLAENKEGIINNNDILKEEGEGRIDFAANADWDALDRLVGF